MNIQELIVQNFFHILLYLAEENKLQEKHLWQKIKYLDAQIPDFFVLRVLKTE